MLCCVLTHGKDFAVCFFWHTVKSMPCVIFDTRQSYNFFLLTSKLLIDCVEPLPLSEGIDLCLVK